ncbi:MAG TPA: hypothetical protein VFW55_00525 [Propionicimonas sp.]|nr:hypothetical protein [Propionicimonas sp.]
MSPMSPPTPDDPLDVDSSTPVPPPVPVLPDSEAGLAPSTGRRYSASMEPGEVVSAAPRRSAATATSPASALEPHLPPVVRPTAPPPVTVQAPTSQAPTLPAPPAVISQAPATAPSLPAPPPVTSQAAVTAPALPTPPPVTSSLRSGSSPTPFSAYPQSVATAPTAPTDAPVLRPPVARPSSSEPSFFSRSQPTPAAGPAAPGEPAAKPAKAPKPARVPREKVPREKKVREPRVRAAKPVAAATAVSGAAEVPAVAGPLKGRRSRPALIVIAAVAAVVVLVAAVVWALTLRSTAPSGGPSESGTAVAQDPFLTAADLGTLGGATWVDPNVDAAGLRPLCLPATADGLPAALRSPSRKVTSSSSPAETVVQALDVYGDDATATQAYAARLVQAGTCADTVALITGANTITGLADSAEVVRLTVQEQTDQFHSLLISRTGRSVSLIDVTTAAAVTASDLANVAAAALSRGCGGELGTCPGSISVATSVPPAGNPFGWLVPADLPRITPGAGRWGATEPKTTLDVVGSLCEAINLKTVAGTQAVGQRTLLLADDSSAPQGFGVDQVVYTFADAKGVSTLAGKLDKNLTGCADRAPTASVKEGPAVKGTGANGAKISGSTYLVTQKTGTNTVVFRVAVLSIDNRLVYLLANPSTSFDFTNADWAKVAVRAGERASQSS